MPKRIQVCTENRLAAPDVLAKLGALGFKVEVETCLDQCTRCSHTAIGLVDGQFKTAPTVAAFLRQLMPETPAG